MDELQTILLAEDNPKDAALTLCEEPDLKKSHEFGTNAYAVRPVYFGRLLMNFRQNE